VVCDVGSSVGINEGSSVGVEVFEENEGDNVGKVIVSHVVSSLFLEHSAPTVSPSSRSMNP